MVAFSTLMLLVVAGQSRAADPAISEMLKRVGEYVAGYGEQTSAVVAVENKSSLVRARRAAHAS